MNNNIQEDYCSFEVSRFLKEKGFGPKREWNPEYVIGYDSNTTIKEFKEEDYGMEDNFLRPTHDIAIKWIRKNFNLHISVMYISSRYTWSIDGEDRFNLERVFDAPEEATEDALLYIKNFI